MEEPKLLIFSSLFPSNKCPNAGLFIRERMFRVAQQIPVIVISPVPWIPFQGILRYWWPHFDLFVLANEGWANVFLEAMACGLPVITTDVGGNKEVVNAPELGTIVPFGDSIAFITGI